MILALAGAAIFDEVPTCLIFSPSIRMAAGASTFPVRGSSNRPALTKVTRAEDWARTGPVETTATTAKTANVASFRMRLNRSPALNANARCFETGNHANRYLLHIACMLLHNK